MEWSVHHLKYRDKHEIGNNFKAIWFLHYLHSQFKVADLTRTAVEEQKKEMKRKQ